jgi:hypothetical protein
VEEDETIALFAVSLANAIFENVTDVGPIVVPIILDLYLREIQTAETTELQVMILQGFMVALWYDCNTTLVYLESR